MTEPHKKNILTDVYLLMLILMPCFLFVFESVSFPSLSHIYTHILFLFLLFLLSLIQTLTLFQRFRLLPLLFNCQQSRALTLIQTCTTVTADLVGMGLGRLLELEHEGSPTPLNCTGLGSQSIRSSPESLVPHPPPFPALLLSTDTHIIPLLACIT